jgi:hypothetical protein
MDWSAFSFENYAILSKRVKIIALYVAKALEKLVKASILNVDTFHVVSHSLGSQLSGFLGRFLSFTIPRITGMLNILLILFIKLSKHCIPKVFSNKKKNNFSVLDINRLRIFESNLKLIK